MLWNLTGGTDGGVHATDPSNASRTMLYDIAERMVGGDGRAVRRAAALPAGGVAVEGPLRDHRADHAAGLAVPVSGIAGDQQAALFGQACVKPGMTKNTYGTGSFVLTNVGTQLPEPVEGLLTTAAWELAERHRRLRDGRRHLRDRRGDPMAARRARRHRARGRDRPTRGVGSDTDGVYVVPAFTGLGSPWWDPYAAAPWWASRGGRAARTSRAPSWRRWPTRPRDVIDAITAATAPSWSKSASTAVPR